MSEVNEASSVIISDGLVGDRILAKESAADSSVRKAKKKAEALNYSLMQRENSSTEKIDNGSKTEVASFYYPLFSCLSASLGSFSTGLTMGGLNTSLEHISRDIDWCLPSGEGCSHTSWHKMLIHVVIFAGLLIGSLLVGRTLKYGRRFSLMLFAGLHIISVTGCAIATSYISLLWARFTSGMSIGGLVVCVTVYISEISPSNLRGCLTSLHHAMVTFGDLVIVLMGFAFHPLDNVSETLHPFDRIWWRVMILFPSLPSLLLLVIFSWRLRFETPQFYARYRHDFINSSRVIRLMHPPNNVAEAEEVLRKAVEKAEEGDATVTGVSIYTIMSNPKYRYVFFVASSLSALQQATGINYYISSSNEMMIESGLTNQNSTLVTSLMMLAHFLFTLPVFWLIESLGRRRLLLYGTVLMILPLTPSIICSWFFFGSNIAMICFITGTIAFMVFFSCSYGPVVWVFISEVFPLQLRHKGTSLCAAVHWVAALVVVAVSECLTPQESTTLFFIMGILSFIFIYLVVEETKSRPVDDSPYV